MLFNTFYYNFKGTASQGVSGVIATKKDEKEDAEKEASEKKKDNILVMSGGEGYIDFRLGK